MLYGRVFQPSTSIHNPVQPGPQQSELQEMPATTQDNMLILIVGEITRWQDIGRDLPRIGQVEYCEYTALDQDMLGRLQPGIILCPLVSRGFDILDIAVLLCHLGFTGRLRVLVPPLPTPEVVIREVSILCPALDFDMIEITTQPVSGTH
jgi:hypothetical protein